jgi:excisionase family DNA binding protein
MSVADAKRRFLTLDQVAERFQLSRRTIERLVAAELMPSVRVGGSRRVDPAELEAWLYPDVSADGSRQGQLRADAETPAERRETSIPARQSSSRQPAGGEAMNQQELERFCDLLDEVPRTPRTVLVSTRPGEVRHVPISALAEFRSRRRERFPRLERAQNLTALCRHMLEREERRREP